MKKTTKKKKPLCELVSRKVAQERLNASTASITRRALRIQEIRRNTVDRLLQEMLTLNLGLRETLIRAHCRGFVLGRAFERGEFDGDEK